MPLRARGVGGCLAAALQAFHAASSPFVRRFQAYGAPALQLSGPPSFPFSRRTSQHTRWMVSASETQQPRSGSSQGSTDQ